MTTEKKRRKSDESRKETILRIRVTEDLLATLKAAAARTGINLSAWATERLLRAARQEEKE